MIDVFNVASLPTSRLLPHKASACTCHATALWLIPCRAGPVEPICWSLWPQNNPEHAKFWKRVDVIFTARLFVLMAECPRRVALCWAFCVWRKFDSQFVILCAQGLDKDGGGSVTADEMHAVLGEEYAAWFVEHCSQKADQRGNKNGVVELEEWRSFFAGLVASVVLCRAVVGGATRPKCQFGKVGTSSDA